MLPPNPAEDGELEQTIGCGPTSNGFVLDMFDDALIVIPLDEARRLAVLNDALETSTTWGEFLTSVGSDVETRSYLNGYYDDGLPAAEEPFD